MQSRSTSSRRVQTFSISETAGFFGGMIKTCGSGRACLPVNMILVVT